MENEQIPNFYTFWENVDHESAGNTINFDSGGDAFWQSYKDVFLTEQPRGSWCAKGLGVTYKSSAKMIAILSKDGNEKILKDGNDIVVIDEFANGIDANNNPFDWNT